jgi:beta-lactamase regulating signal transducer with metallopeptidase domain
VLHPYICFPENAFRALSDSEREAVIQHEIAHIRHWDLLATLTVKVLGDVFWLLTVLHPTGGAVSATEYVNFHFMLNMA